MDKGSHKIAPLVDQLAHACPNVLPYQASNEEEAGVEHRISRE